jgi:hypothetical protein
MCYWYWSELQNAGDLRLYLVVQFGSLLLVALLLVLYPARYRGTRYLVIGLAAYLAAAGGVTCLVGMLRARTRRAGADAPSIKRLQPTALAGS